MLKVMHSVSAHITSNGVVAKYSDGQTIYIDHNVGEHAMCVVVDKNRISILAEMPTSSFTKTETIYKLP